MSGHTDHRTCPARAGSAAPRAEGEDRGDRGEGAENAEVKTRTHGSKKPRERWRWFNSEPIHQSSQTTCTGHD